MLTPPLYCSICSAPCLLPRIPLPPHPPPLTSSSPRYAPTPEGEYDPPDWLAAWYCLRVSSGIVDPTPYLWAAVGEPSQSPLRILRSSCQDTACKATTISAGATNISSRPIAVAADSTTDTDNGNGNGAAAVVAATNATGANARASPSPDSRRCITIHAYCLSAVRSTIRQSSFSNARTHEEGVMLSWSLPRWTGHEPWVSEGMRDQRAYAQISSRRSPSSSPSPTPNPGPDLRACSSAGPEEADQSHLQGRGQGQGANQGGVIRHGQGGGRSYSMSPGYWGGMADQRERWCLTGNHLDESDIISPLDVGHPSSPGLRLVPEHASITSRPRPIQKSMLPMLPSPILTRIVQYLLDDPQPPPPFTYKHAPGPNCISSAYACSQSHSHNLSHSTQPRAHKLAKREPTVDLTPLLDPASVASFISLRHTCSDLHHVHLQLPSWIFTLLTLDSVRRFRSTLLQRWTANPTGVGSAAKLWSALDEMFMSPIVDALEATRTRAGYDGTDSDVGWTTRDVWDWWNYDTRWKSRKRVWWCVVQGCATARDADWW